MEFIGKMTKIVEEKLESLLQEGRYKNLHNIIHHGSTSIMNHCVNVAETSYKLKNKFRIKLNEDELIQGALLHDYFLYDWHEKGDWHCIHGFTHPKKAMLNAIADYNIDKRVQHIIKVHMFPLTITSVPITKEAWVVMMADKLCALKEHIELYKMFFNKHYEPKYKVVFNCDTFESEKSEI